MNGNELYKALSEIPMDEDDRALVNVSYQESYLMLTYWNETFLCQKFIKCDTAQDVDRWSLTVNSEDFIYALHEASDYRNPQTKDKMRVWYRPSKNLIVVEGEKHQQADVPPAIIYAYDRDPLDLSGLGDNLVEAEIALLHKEWAQLYPFIHVAKKGGNNIELTTQDSHVWVRASSPSMYAYAYLKARDNYDSTYNLSLSLDVVEYIQSLDPQPSYIEFQLYENKVAIMLMGERLIIDRVGHNGFNMIETQDGSMLRVNRLDLIKTLQSCAYSSWPSWLNDPDCNQISLSCTPKTGLVVSGSKNTQKLKTLDRPTEESKIMLCSVALLDLLEEIKFDDIELEIPTEDNPYEPLKMTTRGTVYLVAGVVKKERSFHRLQPVTDAWDESEPHRELVYSRCQSDGLTLNFFLVEESPLEPHFSVKELEEFFVKGSPYEDEEWEEYLSPVEQEFYRAAYELQSAYRSAIAVARWTRKSGALSQELRDRLSELKQVFQHFAHCFDHDLNDHIVSNLDSEYLKREIKQVRYALENIQVKAGRLLEALKDLDKTYRIEMTLEE